MLSWTTMLQCNWQVNWSPTFSRFRHGFILLVYLVASTMGFSLSLSGNLLINVTTTTKMTINMKISHMLYWVLSQKFQVHKSVSCWVMTHCCQKRCSILWLWHQTFWSWRFLICQDSCLQPLLQVLVSYETYHGFIMAQIRSHLWGAQCTVSRVSQKQPHIIPDRYLPINDQFYGASTTIKVHFTVEPFYCSAIK